MADSKGASGSGKSEGGVSYTAAGLGDFKDRERSRHAPPAAAHEGDAGHA